MEGLISLACLGLMLIFLVALFGILMWLYQKPSPSKNKGVGLASDDSLAGELLELIYNNSNPTQVLNNLISDLKNGVTIPPSTEQDPDDAIEPPTSVVEPVVTPPAPIAPDSPPSAEQTPPPPKRALHERVAFGFSKMKRIWRSFSNIELTLYLGATLLFIGAAIFALSNRDSPAISISISTFFALTLLVVGEMIVRRRSQEKVVGETLRAIGFLLIPFIVWEFYNSVLSNELGNDTNRIFAQMMLSGGVAAFYYALYRFTSTNRSTAYLASFSLGFFILLLPDTVNPWRAPALIFVATCLFMAARQLEADGRKLLQWPKSPKVSALAESNFIIGGVYVLISWGLAFYFGSLETPTFSLGTLPATVYFTLHTLLLAGLSFWFRDARLAGGAAFVSGIALYSGLFPDQESFDWTLFIGWNGLAMLLFVLPPLIASHLPNSRKTLTAMSLFWSGAAFVYAFIGAEGAKLIANVVSASAADPNIEPQLVLVASLALIGAFVASATRFRRDWLLWPAFVLLHIAISAMLALLDFKPDNLALVQTISWLGLAALWLTPVRSDAWPRRFFTYAFVVEAVWALLYASYASSAVDYTAVLAGTLLTLGWIEWSRRKEQPVGVAVAIAQGVYIQFAIARSGPLPQEALLLMTLTAGTLLTFLAPRLPKYAQRPSNLGGLLLLFVAPITGVIGTGIGAGQSYWPLRDHFYPEQATLALSTLLYALQTKRSQAAWLVAPTTLLGYILVGWVTYQYARPAFATVGLALALVLYWVAPRAPKPSDDWLDNLALATPFVTRLIFFLMVGMGLANDNSASLSLLTLLLTVVFYAWQAKRRESGGLALFATFYAYDLVWSFTLTAAREFAAEAAPFAVLALALLLLRIAPLVPAQKGEAASTETKIGLDWLLDKVEAIIVKWVPSKNVYATLLERLALLTIFLAPLAGYYLEWPDVDQDDWLTVASQIALALAAMLYGGLAVHRNSNRLTLGTTFLTYALVVWLVVDPDYNFPAAARPFVALGLSGLTLLAAQRGPGGSGRWLDPLAMAVAFVAPVLSIGGEDKYFGQFSLLLSALFFGGRGWLAKSPYLKAISGFQFYMLYAWIAAAASHFGIENPILIYTVPLSLLFLAYSRLFSNRRQTWEALGMMALLGPVIGLASQDNSKPLYWGLLLFFGLLLLGVGASFSRQILTIAGTLALLVFGLLAVIRSAFDSPELIVGLVGAGLMIMAVFLIWWRNRKSSAEEASQLGQIMASFPIRSRNRKSSEEEASQPGQIMATQEASQPGQIMATEEASQPGQIMATEKPSPPGQTMPTQEASQPGQTMPTQEASQPGQTMPTQEASQPGQIMPTQEASQPGQTMATQEASQLGQTMTTQEASQLGQIMATFLTWWRNLKSPEKKPSKKEPKKRKKPRMRQKSLSGARPKTNLPDSPSKSPIPSPKGARTSRGSKPPMRR